MRRTAPHIRSGEDEQAQKEHQQPPIVADRRNAQSESTEDAASNCSLQPKLSEIEISAKSTAKADVRHGEGRQGRLWIVPALERVKQRCNDHGSGDLESIPAFRGSQPDITREVSLNEGPRNLLVEGFAAAPDIDGNAALRPPILLRSHHRCLCCIDDAINRVRVVEDENVQGKQRVVRNWYRADSLSVVDFMSCVAILRLQLPLCVDTGRDRRFNLLRILRHDVREVLPKEAKIAFGVHFESIQQGGDRVERVLQWRL
mmetsp:Transcript_16619/g.63206  ORF Transcript_16619/g.63206 Transcript_16619/m.63206 type:complete len:259 (+) Transcript_16619:2297-3073(+)